MVYKLSTSAKFGTNAWNVFEMPVCRKVLHLHAFSCMYVWLSSQVEFYKYFVTFLGCKRNAFPPFLVVSINNCSIITINNYIITTKHRNVGVGPLIVYKTILQKIKQIKI